MTAAQHRQQQQAEETPRLVWHAAGSKFGRNSNENPRGVARADPSLVPVNVAKVGRPEIAGVQAGTLAAHVELVEPIQAVENHHLRLSPHMLRQRIFQRGRDGVPLGRQRVLDRNGGDPQRRTYLGLVLEAVQLEAHGV